MRTQLKDKLEGGGNAKRAAIGFFTQIALLLNVCRIRCLFAYVNIFCINMGKEDRLADTY